MRCGEAGVDVADSGRAGPPPQRGATADSRPVGGEIFARVRTLGSTRRMAAEGVDGTIGDDEDGWARDTGRDAAQAEAKV